MRKKLILLIVCFILMTILNACGQSGELDATEAPQNMEETLAAKTDTNEQEMNDTQQNDMLVIELSWDGVDENGDLLDVGYVLTGVFDDGTNAMPGEVESANGMNELVSIDGTVIGTIEQEVGRITYYLHKLDGTYELYAEPANYLEDGNIMLGSGIRATVQLPGSDEKVTYVLEDGLYRSYTGVWVWAPFGIDHGKLTEYDTSWITGDEPEASESNDKLADGDYAVSYVPEDLFEAEGELYLSFTYYDYDTHDTETILELQPGDTFTYYGEEVLIENIDIYPWEYGDVQMYNVYMNDEEIALMSDMSNPDRMAEIESYGDGYIRYYEVGFATLKLDKAACFFDQSQNPDPSAEAQEIPYKEIAAYFADEYWGASPIATTLTVKDNKIVSISQRWMS